MKVYRYGIGIFIILISIIFIGFFVTSNKSNSKNLDEVKYVIGVSQANLSEPWSIAMNEEIKKEATKYKNIKVIYRDAGQNAEKQEKDINELLNDGVDLLIVSFNDSQKLTPSVSKAYKSVPVIVLDRAVEGYDYTLFIGPDNQSIGIQAGSLISDMMGSKGGKVIEVMGTLDSPPVVDRSKGFKEVIEKQKNINISNSIIGDWQRDKTEDKITEIIKGNNPFDVIFAQSDYMALGAYKAAKKYGLNNVRFVGVDGLPGENGGLELVKQGILQGTFTCPTGGKEAIDYAIDILKRKKEIPKKIILRSDKITSVNVDNYIEKQIDTPKVSYKKNLTLGYAQLISESSWRDANAKSIKEAANDGGVNLDFIEAGTTQKDQIDTIRTLINKRVDVIAFSPVIQSGWDEVLKEAKNAGIPIILSDRTVNSDDALWSTFMGSDFEEEGRRAAKWLIENINLVRKQKNQVNIVELQGTIDATPEIDRSKGFKEGIDNNKNIKIIASKSGDFKLENAKEIMKGFLNKYGKSINVVYAHNDDMAIGAISAIEEYGLKPGKDILIIAIDGTRQALQAIKTGKMNCTVECNPLLGPQLIKGAKELAGGKELPLKIITVEDIFTNETTNEIISNRKY